MTSLAPQCTSLEQRCQNLNKEFLARHMFVGLVGSGKNEVEASSNPTLHIIFLVFDCFLFSFWAPGTFLRRDVFVEHQKSCFYRFWKFDAVSSIGSIINKMASWQVKPPFLGHFWSPWIILRHICTRKDILNYQGENVVLNLWRAMNSSFNQWFRDWHCTTSKKHHLSGYIAWCVVGSKLDLQFAKLNLMLK